MPPPPAVGAIREASADTIARYTRPSSNKGRCPLPFAVDAVAPAVNQASTQDMFRFGDEDDAPHMQKDALDGFLQSKANPLAQRRTPPSIFSGGSGRPVTPSEVWPDSFVFGETSSAEAKGAGPIGPGPDRSRPLQPTNSRRQHAAAEALTSSQAAFGRQGATTGGGMMAAGAPRGGAGRGRRPPSGGFAGLTLG